MSAEQNVSNKIKTTTTTAVDRIPILHKELTATRLVSAASDYCTSKLTVVIPCFNEAARLNPDTLAEFMHNHANMHFLFVDDGSTDQTLTILEDLQRLNKGSCSCHRLGKNSGKAEAVREGLLRALENDPAYVAFWDADLATPLEAIDEFSTVLERKPEVQIVAGVRVPLLGHEIHRSRFRYILGRMFSLLASSVIGLRLYDTQCGAKMFRVSDSTKAIFSKQFIGRWIFDVELLTRYVQIAPRLQGKQIQSTIYELPLKEWREVSGSKLRPSDFVLALFDLARICIKYRFLRWRPDGENS